MEAQRKVTSFVTRGSGPDAELLVFWHTGSGVQVPAGSVEEGEPYEAAAVREASEETGLADLRLVSRLGSRTFDLPQGSAVLRRDMALLTRPRADAPKIPWVLARVRVEILDRRHGFARIVYRESDEDEPGDPIETARFEGWVPEEALLYRQEREFYHFHADAATPERWQVLENGVHDFHLYWVPLVPKPTMLVESQQRWLEEFYKDLLATVSATPR